MELKSVKSKAHDVTRLEVLRVLEFYGLKEKFNNGRISLSVDGALFRMFSARIDFNGIENRCQTHVGKVKTLISRLNFVNFKFHFRWLQNSVI